MNVAAGINFAAVRAKHFNIGVCNGEQAAEAHGPRNGIGEAQTGRVACRLRYRPTVGSAGSAVEGGIGYGSPSSPGIGAYFQF